MPEGGEGTNPTVTNTINKVMKAVLKQESSWRQSQLAGPGRSLCPARRPRQLELAQGLFSGWERPQTDLAGLWETSQTAGRALVPTGCVPAAAGTNLSQTSDRTYVLGGSCPACHPCSPMAMGLNNE